VAENIEYEMLQIVAQRLRVDMAPNSGHQFVNLLLHSLRIFVYAAEKGPILGPVFLLGLGLLDLGPSVVVEELFQVVNDSLVHDVRPVLLLLTDHQEEVHDVLFALGSHFG
jgi:hypothetical protein